MYSRRSLFVLLLAVLAIASCAAPSNRLFDLGRYKAIGKMSQERLKARLSLPPETYAAHLAFIVPVSSPRPNVSGGIFSAERTVFKIRSNDLQKANWLTKRFEAKNDVWVVSIPTSTIKLLSSGSGFMTLTGSSDLVTDVYVVYLNSVFQIPL